MIKLVSNTSIPPEGIELASPEDLYSFCEDHDTLAIDTETEGDFDFNNQIITYQVGNADTQFVVDASYLNPKSIKQYLEDSSKLKLFQNALFDLKVLKFCGVEVNNVGDTFLNELILNCGLLKSGFDLATLSHKYTDYKMGKEVRGLIVDEGLTKRVIEYAAKDVQVLPEIYSKQLDLLEEHGLMTVQRLEHKALHGFCDMEYHGMAVDADQLKRVASEDLERLESLKKDLDQVVVEDERLSKIFKKQFIQTNLFDTPRAVNINYNSPLQIHKALKAIGIKAQTTDKEFLKKIEGKHPFIGKLLEYRNIQKRCSTYGYNLLNCINPHTKRIHTRFWQVLNTGRISSGKRKKKNQDYDYPNMQNIPADNRYRNIFTASKGHKLVMCDYGSQELALIAADSKDEVWERIIQNGEDLHSVVAEKVFEKDWEDATEDGCEFAVNKEKCGCKKHKEMRTTIKTINYALSYQAGAQRIADTLNISTKRASEIIEMYFSTFPKLKEYFEKTKRFGKRHLYIKTFAPFGRKRFFTEPTTYKELSSIEKESANTRIQGTGADIIKLAIVYIKDYIEKNNYPAKLLLQVHDELITEVEEGYEEEWAEIKAELMRKASDKVCPLPIEVDTNIADKWEK